MGTSILERRYLPIGMIVGGLSGCGAMLLVGDSFSPGNDLGPYAALVGVSVAVATGLGILAGRPVGEIVTSALVAPALAFAALIAVALLVI